MHDIHTRYPDTPQELTSGREVHLALLLQSETLIT